MNIAVNVVVQEAYRWYLTSNKIYRMYPGTNKYCWRCNEKIGSMTHIWWACPKLQRFWSAVHYEITSLLKLSLNEWRFKCQYLLLMNKLSVIKALRTGVN